MVNIDRLIEAWEIFRDSNPYEICEGREFRAIKEPEYCMGQMIEDTIALLKEQEHKDKMHHALAEDWKRIQELMKEDEGIVPYIDIDEAKCPTCKVKLTRQELLGDDVLYEDFFDYCPRCGRKVKWE